MKQDELQAYIESNFAVRFDLMRFYHDKSVIRHGADTREADIAFQDTIVCGKFVDRERPTFLDSMNARFSEKFGSSYVPYEG